MELQGFQALLDQDIEAAIDAFAQAETAWPEYHNVAEIRRLLLSERRKLLAASESNDSRAWEEFYTTILAKYSWGMPEDIRNTLKKRAHNVE